MSALSQKLAQKELVILDEFKLTEPKTKEVQAFLDAFKFESSTLLVLDEKNADVMRATNNLQKTEVTTSALLNVYDVVANKQLVLTKSAVKKLEEAYAE